MLSFTKWIAAPLFALGVSQIGAANSAQAQYGPVITHSGSGISVSIDARYPVDYGYRFGYSYGYVPSYSGYPPSYRSGFYRDHHRGGFHPNRVYGYGSPIHVSPGRYNLYRSPHPYQCRCSACAGINRR